MGDYILKEIDKIGILLRGILHKLKLIKDNSDEFSVEDTKLELVEKLHIDMDELLAKDDFIRILVEEHEFDEPSMELFAEVLADMAFAAERVEDRHRFGRAACEIYKFQDVRHAPASFNRYYILKELARLDQDQ